MTMITRRFRRFMRKNRFAPKKKKYIRGEESKEKEKDKEKEQLAICYECKSLDHFRADCPLL